MLDTEQPTKRRRTGDCERCEQIAKAFVFNDLGEPDFDGHRKAHAQMIEATKVLQGYKVEATKRVIGWIGALLLGALSTGLFSWLREHLI